MIATALHLPPPVDPTRQPSSSYFVVATIAVLLASYLVKTTDGHGDYFQADQAWLYVVILSVGYMISRGLTKSGSRHHDDP